MKTYYPLVLYTILCFLGCSEFKSDKQQPLFDYIPSHTFKIITTNNPSTLDNSYVFKSIIEGEIHEQISPQSPFLICYSKHNTTDTIYTILAKLKKSEDLLKQDDIQILKDSTSTWYIKKQDHIFIASSSKDYFKTNLKSSTKTDLKTIYNATNHDKDFSVLFDLKHQYTSLEIDSKKTETFFSGIVKPKDSVKHIINIFKNTTPQEHKIQNIIPLKSKGYTSFTFDNFNTIKDNLQPFRNKKISYEIPDFIYNVNEIGEIYIENDTILALHAIDAIILRNTMSLDKNIIDTYRETPIFKFSEPDLFKTLCHPLIHFENAKLFCEIGNFFVFSKNLKILKEIISTHKNNDVLGMQEYFKNAYKTLNESSSFIAFCKNGGISNTYFNSILETPFKANVHKNAMIQFVYDTNFAHINGLLSKRHLNSEKQMLYEDVNIKLNNDILGSPQFIKNHNTGQKDIIIQDINHKLYLISNTGKILWKKQLEDAIIGDVKQIDIYKNGKLQMVFSTSKKLYVLDRLGRDVDAFPIVFKNEITQPVAVFDYDKHKNYRFLIVQGKYLRMYNAKGRIVKGFKFKSANDNLIGIPKHFRIGTKDYIVFKTKKKLYILDRMGKPRITPKQEFTYSKQPVFLHKNAFITTTSRGNLIRIDRKGNTGITYLKLSDKHTMAAKQHTLVFQDDNILNIQDKTMTLKFGNYTTPRVFKVKGKSYVTLTDLQSHNIYLYDDKGKLQPQFPVYGNSSIALDQIDKDSAIEFITKGESNTLILYKLNI